MSQARFSEHVVSDSLDGRCCFSSDLSSVEAAMAARCSALATVHLLIDPFAANPSTQTCEEHFHAASALALDWHLMELACSSPETYWVGPYPERGISSHCSLTPYIETEPTEND